MWRCDDGVCLLIDIPSDCMTSGKEVWGVVGVVCGSSHSSTEVVKYWSQPYWCFMSDWGVIIVSAYSLTSVAMVWQVVRRRGEWLVWYVEVAILVPNLWNTDHKQTCVSCLIETMWRCDDGVCLLIDIPSDCMTSGKEARGVVGVVCGSSHYSSEFVKYRSQANMCIMSDWDYVEVWLLFLPTHWHL